jgi:hypothetical protein
MVATALITYGPVGRLKDVSMILPVLVRLKDIVTLGRDFPWPKPVGCPRCKGNRLWGHGFVGAFFDGVPGQVLLRRFRCPGCGFVLRLRPDGYFKRFQTRVSSIRLRIVYRLLSGRWLEGLSRSRQGYWLKNLRRRVIARWGLSWKDRLIQGFDILFKSGEIPVSRLR